jgi:hypothetical protein
MTGKKNRNAIPFGTAKASGTTAPAGTIDVYTVANHGTKTYLGWVTDKNKLVFFSRTGDRIINPSKYSKFGAMGAKDSRPVAARRFFPVSELLIGPNVDKLAAEIIIEWINDNSITEPKQFGLGYALFGGTSPCFEAALNVHHAMHAFDLFRETRGQVVRTVIMDYINISDDPMIPNVADSKCCMEKIDFDGGVLSSMMTQIMWRSVNRNIDPAVLDEIKKYCSETERYEGMKRIGEQVVAKKLSYRNKEGGKPIEHGW